MDYQAQGKKIQKQRDQLLQQTLKPILDFVNSLPKDKVQKITNSGALELAKMLNSGEATSVQIMNVFAYRSGTVGNQIKAITDQNFKAALNLAQECDLKRKETGWKNAISLDIKKQEFSPLFGVPISIKDTVDMKGFSSTIGCIARYNQKQDQDGQIIKVLKLAGIIPYVRSNVPQLCMNYECNNRLWGNTQNPWDATRTPGGSSGGQGALISSRSSPIGLGGDIGGSLRIPAQFCGLTVLKSTSQRITSGGHTFFSPTINGQINIRSTLGPMSRNVEDLAAFLSVIMNQNYYTSQTLDVYRKLIPFDLKLYNAISEQKQRKFRIGFYDSFELFPPTKASKRAVHEVVQILTHKGHTLVPITIPRVEEMTKLLVSVMVAEGDLDGYEQILDGQPLSEQYKAIDTALKLPKFIHWATCKILEKFSPRMAFTFCQVKQLSTSEYLQLSNLQKQLRKVFIDMWRQNELDFIVCPGFGTQAPIIGQSNKLSPLPAMYTNIYNVLDMTVGSLPVSLVRKDEEQYECKYNDQFDKATAQNMKGSSGLPVGIQVVALPYKDQQVLGLMRVVERQLKFKEKYEYPF